MSTFRHPGTVLTDRFFAVPLDHQRPAQFIFSEQVQQKLSEIRKAEAEAKIKKAATAA